MDIKGEYLLRFFGKVSKWFKISGAILGHLLLSVLGNISKFPAAMRFFHIANFFWKAIILSVEDKIVSFLPCMLLFKRFSSWNILARYANFEHQWSSLKHSSNFLANRRSMALLLVCRNETILFLLTTIALVCAGLKCNVVLPHSHKVS